jgi:hypothetical protein
MKHVIWTFFFHALVRDEKSHENMKSSKKELFSVHGGRMKR